MPPGSSTSSSSMQAAMQAKQALVAEKQALLQQQAAVLQEQIRAGLPLAGSRQRLHGAEVRQQLVAQLVQEEAAAEAALEALKQGSSLAKARAVGERVLQQTRDLQQTDASTAPGAGPAAAAAGAGSLGQRQRLQSVLLTTSAPGTEQGAPAKSVRIVAAAASPHAAASTTKQQPQQQTSWPADTLSAQSSEMEPLQLDHYQHGQQHHQQQYSPHVQPGSGTSRGDGGGAAAGAASSSQLQQAPTADFLALQQQMVQLQNTLAAQQLVQQQQQQHPAAYAPQPLQPHAGQLQLPHLPPPFAAAAAWPAGVPAGAWGPASSSSSPVPGLGGYRTASLAYPYNPAATAAVGPGAAGVAPTGISSSIGIGAPAQADASLAAALAAHVRDMTLLRMDVERTRGAAELQQARAELAALQQTAGAAQAPGHGRGTRLEAPWSKGTSAQAGIAAGVPPMGGTPEGLDGAASTDPQQQQQQQQQQRWLEPEGGMPLSVQGPAHQGQQQQDWQGPSLGPNSRSSSPGDKANISPAGDGPSTPSAAAVGGVRAAAAAEAEVLSMAADGVLVAARGSGGPQDVLQVHVVAAGPFSKRGTYRVAVTLYDGFQPMAAAPGCQVTASTGRRVVSTQAAASTAGDPAATAAGSASIRLGTAPAASSAAAAGAAAAAPPGIARFQEPLSIRGLALGASLQLVFELYCAKPSVAGLPSRELLVAWAATPLLQGGQVLPGLQSLPLLRLPILLSPGPARHWSYDGALIDFRLARYPGAPGELDAPLSGGAGGPGSGGNRRVSGLAALQAGGGSSGSSGHEDLPGVPAEAWVRVARGLLPSEPYTPGDGIVVVVDGARFLPACTTISRILVSLWSSGGQLLAGPYEGVSQPGSDALAPVYGCKATLDAAQSSSSFDDPTATLLFQVHTIERSSRALRVVGFGLLAAFLDPRDGGQPLSRNTADYVINAGAFQIPLHAGAPPTDAPLRMTSLDDTPRVACASLLVRIMTPEAAKAQRRKPAPQYGDRVYDSVARAMPTALERRLFGRLLGARQPWAVREAARLVAWYKRQPGGLSGRRGSRSSSSSTDTSRRTTAADAAAAAGSATRAYANSGRQQQQAAVGAAEGGSSGGLFSRLFAGVGGGDAALLAGGAGSQGAGPGGLRLNTGDPAAAEPERQEDLEAAKAELLPPNDGNTIDWIADTLAAAEAAAAAAAASNSSSSSSNSGGGLSFINFNLATEYLPELGFYVAVDGAMRLARPLPAACIISTSLPGSMYQDHPLVDDVRLTLDYDLDAPLSAPRWLDGFQGFTGLPYHPGLVLLLDVRCLVPGSSTAAPAGWACLPVFEAAGPCVASGVYHLPLFQGIPSHQLLTELTEGGDPNAVMAAAIAAGRVRPTLDCSSVCVRLVCGSRQGQLEAPAWSIPLAEQRLTRHTVSELGVGFLSEMRKPLRSRTYAQAKPKALTDEQWVDQINDTLLKISGLDEQQQDARDD